MIFIIKGFRTIVFIHNVSGLLKVFVELGNLHGTSNYVLYWIQKQRTCRIVNVAVPADHRVELKESEKRDKYLNLASELKSHSPDTLGGSKNVLDTVGFPLKRKVPHDPSSAEVKKKVRIYIYIYIHTHTYIYIYGVVFVMKYIVLCWSRREPRKTTSWNVRRVGLIT